MVWIEDPKQGQPCLQPKPHPEQGPNSPQLYEGRERCGGYRRKVRSWQRLVHEIEKEAILITYYVGAEVIAVLHY